MFCGIAQRLVPSLGRSSKLVTPIISMCRGFHGVSLMGRSGGMSVMSRSGSTSSSLLVDATWMNTPKIALFPTFLSRSLISSSSPVAPPSSLSSLTPSYLAGISAQQQTRGFATGKHKRVIRQSKGFRGRANRCFRIAIRRLEKSWQYAYRDRKNKKREFRRLWISRLNAGVRQHGMSYSKFIAMQGKSGVILDRKILSGLAMYEPFSFKAVVDVVQKTSATNGGGQ